MNDAEPVELRHGPGDGERDRSRLGDRDRAALRKLVGQGGTDDVVGEDESLRSRLLERPSFGEGRVFRLGDGLCPLEDVRPHLGLLAVFVVEGRDADEPTGGLVAGPEHRPAATGVEAVEEPVIAEEERPLLPTQQPLGLPFGDRVPLHEPAGNQFGSAGRRGAGRERQPFELPAELVEGRRLGELRFAEKRPKLIGARRRHAGNPLS